jgi:hypothetical protein
MGTLLSDGYGMVACLHILKIEHQKQTDVKIQAFTN